ncbi:MAG: TolC family protein [Acidobacteriota bacterium]
MKRIRFSFLTILIICFSLFSYSQEQKQIRELSLEDSIIKALKNNLDINVEIFTPKISDALILKSEGIFSPNFSLNSTYQQMNQPSTSVLEGARVSTQDTKNFSFSFQKRFNLGTNVQVSLNNNIFSTNSRFYDYNPNYTSQLRVNIIQPLLRNFGEAINTKEIKVAQNNKEISVAQVKSKLNDLIYQVQEAYWNLVFAIEELKVKRQSLKLAQDLLEQNRIQVKIGTLAPIEILVAEAEVANREVDILSSETQVKLWQDQLKKIINLPGEEEKWEVEIVPTSKPSFEKMAIDLDKCIETAISTRPELEQLKIDVENNNINIKFYKNQLLPSLDLTGSVWSTGRSGDMVIYENNNPFFGKIIGKIEGSTTDSIKDALKALYKNYYVALNISYPLFTAPIKADLARSQLELSQSLLRIKSLEQTINLDVRTAVREIEANLKKLDATKKARELAEKKLEAEQKKLNVGLSTNYQVLQFQRDLSIAQTSELKAIIDYNLSIAKLNKAMGKSLEAHNIKFNEIIK